MAETEMKPPCVYCGGASSGTYMILGSERHACAPCFAKYEAAVAARAADMPTPEERIAAMQRGYDAAQAGKNACVLCLGVFVPPLVSDGAPVVAHKLCPRCHDAYTLGREHQTDIEAAPDTYICTYCGEPTHQQPYVHQGKAWPSCCSRHACIDQWTGVPTEAPDTDGPIVADGSAVAIRLSFARAKDTGETSLIVVSTVGGVEVGPAVSLPMDADFRKQLVEFLVSDEIRDAVEPPVAHVPGAALAVEDGARPAGEADRAGAARAAADARARSSLRRDLDRAGDRGRRGLRREAGRLAPDHPRAH